MGYLARQLLHLILKRLHSAWAVAPQEARHQQVVYSEANQQMHQEPSLAYSAAQSLNPPHHSALRLAHSQQSPQKTSQLRQASHLDSSVPSQQEARSLAPSPPEVSPPPQHSAIRNKLAVCSVLNQARVLHSAVVNLARQPTCSGQTKMLRAQVPLRSESQSQSPSLPLVLHPSAKEARRHSVAWPAPSLLRLVACSAALLSRSQRRHYQREEQRSRQCSAPNP